MSLLLRSLLGVALAATLVLAARRARALTASGGWAALVVGGVVTAAGWHWTAVLLAFFVSSSLLSGWRREHKERETASIIEKGGARDAWQVVANGGIFALCALGVLVLPWAGWSLAGVGAIAAATADTWATEVGTAIGGVPRSLRGFQRVAAGTSGAVSIAGTAAMCAGAIFLGTTAVLAGFDQEVFVPVMIGGIAGALTDTLIGATWQERRWCTRCSLATERHVHDCGSATERRRGVAGFDNDAVNLTSCAVGAVVALLCGR